MEDILFNALVVLYCGCDLFINAEILRVEVSVYRYALLEAFYEGLEAAISLLGIRRQLCTFEAVCATVEATTKRYAVSYVHTRMCPVSVAIFLLPVLQYLY